MVSQSTKPVKTFLSYSHEDERYRKQLRNHLSALIRQGLIESWDDREIEAGENWEEESLKHFNEAGMILCLISANFITSNHCYNIELQRALDRQKAGKVRVIPILLSDCGWQNTPFHELQIIPRDKQAILSRSDRHRAFTKVTQEIEKVAKSLNLKNT